MSVSGRWPRAWAAVSVLLAGWLLVTKGNQTWADGAPGLSDGWLLNPQDVSYLLMGPAGSDSLQGWGAWAAAGHGRLYDLEELPLLWTELGVRPPGGSLLPAPALILERLGGDFLSRESRSLLLRWGENPRVGGRIRSTTWTLAGERMKTARAGDLEVRFRFGLGGTTVGKAALYLQVWEESGWPSGPRRRKAAEFKILRPNSALACRLDRLADGTPVFALEGMVRLGSGIGLGLRGDPVTGVLGGNLVVLVRGVQLETSHLVHPALGVTHRFMVGAGDPTASSR